jgi:hypothetical protein
MVGEKVKPSTVGIAVVGVIVGLSVGLMVGKGTGIGVGPSVPSRSSSQVMFAGVV